MSIKPQDSDKCQSDLSLTNVFPDWEKRSSSHTCGDFELTFSLEKVTPEIADKLIKTQRLNRRVAPSRVLEYARRMEQNEWALSDALKFDDSGALIDGQHRLLAVCRSGLSYWFPLIAGYPRHSQDVLDLGLNRTVAQIGQLQGLGTTTHHVSIVRALFLPLPNYTGNTSMLSSPQKVLGLLVQHQEAVCFAAKTFGSRPLKYAPIRAIVARAWYHENHKRLEEFLNVFDTGYSQGKEDSAAIALRNTLLKMREKGDEGGQSNRRILSLKTVTALQCFLAGQERTGYLRESELRKWKIAGVDD
jgi:hypothetical protein